MLITPPRNTKPDQAGSIIAYLIILVLVVSALAGVAMYVVQSTNLAHARSDLLAAQHYAQGGAVLACRDLAAAYADSTAAFPGNLTSLTAPYTQVTSLTTSTQAVYQRTMSSPFNNQTVTAQIWVPNSASASTARVMASATVGRVTQQATVNLQMAVAFGAAIISVNPGTTAQGLSKPVAEDGNVVINGSNKGYLVVDGGSGLAVLANGQVNVDNNYANVPSSAISKVNYGTANEIPDYTAQGTANSLFDFNRFIAVANATTNSYNTNTYNNHFTNVLSFANTIKASRSNTVEGVVVVDINQSDSNWSKAGDSSLFPSGINVHGTLFYNFGPGFNSTTKFTMTADLNINPANLSGLVATNSSSYTNITGYPPVYMNTNSNPINVNVAPAYANFTAADDLPALMYSIGEVDIHGNANVSGVCYTPSYMEIENKTDGQIQYFRGTMIMGQGIYLENKAAATSIISYDPHALDRLATAGNRLKTPMVTYWQ